MRVTEYLENHAGKPVVVHYRNKPVTEVIRPVDQTLRYSDVSANQGFLSTYLVEEDGSLHNFPIAGDFILQEQEGEV